MTPKIIKFGSIATMARLEEWYRAQCNGDWEHTYGISIETLDNPGWSVEIEVKDTLLYGVPFATVERVILLDVDWLRCEVMDGVFRGSGGIGRLAEILELFLNWADEHR